ncbi:TetR/AcrR family transcriptional regulator [Aeromicrobium sp. CTD01-1L150]|uniref:TetR/AcrR family transcriptional regulator n=1 Tax=Aeromicrobium sp. CTD01-1L150 TaxID=3341830 RepID=UPI0035BFAD58
MARIPADERRQQLVEAAIRVMARDGVAKATTRAIVGEAGMPLGVFHYCFRSKRELLEMVIATLKEQTVERVLAVTDPAAPVRDAVRQSLGAYWQHVLAHPQEHRLTYELTQYAVRDPELASVAHSQYELYLKANTDFLEAAAEQLGVRYTVPVPELARYLLTIVDGLTLNWLMLGDDATAEAVLDHVADHVATLTAPAAQGSATR